MSLSLVMRRSGLSMGRRMVRFESTSTTNKAAETAKQTASQASSTASEYTSKAQQGLSRVTSAAGPAIVGAAKGVSGALSRVGGRTGRLVAFVEGTGDTHSAPFPPSASPALRLLRAIGIVVHPAFALHRPGERGRNWQLPIAVCFLQPWLQWLTILSLRLCSQGSFRHLLLQGRR